jgi:hypothetical protein
MTKLMDLNCHRLTDEEINNHLLRIKRRGCSAPRELEKLLESVNKERSLNHSLTASQLSATAK